MLDQEETLIKYISTLSIWRLKIRNFFSYLDPGIKPNSLVEYIGIDYYV